MYALRRGVSSAFKRFSLKWGSPTPTISLLLLRLTAASILSNSIGFHMHGIPKRHMGGRSPHFISPGSNGSWMGLFLWACFNIQTKKKRTFCGRGVGRACSLPLVASQHTKAASCKKWCTMVSCLQTGSQSSLVDGIRTNAAFH